MTPGQTRVIVLLLVLFALEAVIHPGIKQWIANVRGQVGGALNLGANSNSNATKPAGLPSVSIPRPLGGKCPPGYSFNPGTGRCQQ